MAPVGASGLRDLHSDGAAAWWAASHPSAGAALVRRRPGIPSRAERQHTRDGRRRPEGRLRVLPRLSSGLVAQLVRARA
jgi:hypothetical protein